MHAFSRPALQVRSLRALLIAFTAVLACAFAPASASAAYNPVAWSAWGAPGASGVGSVQPFHALTGAAAGASIDGTGAFPVDVAISPDGSTGYAAMWFSNEVVPFATSSGVAGPAIAISQPNAMAVTPDGSRVFVVAADGLLHRIRTADHAAEGAPASVVALGAMPMNQLGISTDGATVYVADALATSVSAVDAETLTSVPIATGGADNSAGLAVDPDGSTVYIETAGSSIHLLDTATNAIMTVDTLIPKGSDRGIAVDPAGEHLYWAAGGEVYQLDLPLTGPQPGAPSVAMDGVVTSLAVTPDSAVVHASARSVLVPYNYVGLIDAASPTLDVLATVPFNDSAMAADTATLPNQPPLTALAAVAPQTAGVAAGFDASASTDDDAVSRYDWNFGDGSMLASGGATPSHTYANPGTYTVTVTTADPQGCSTAVVFTGQTVSCNGSMARATETRTVTVGKRASSLTIACTPEAIQLGEQATCTATVADTSGGTAVRPTGTVTFTISGQGTLSSPTCELPATGPTACSVVLTASPDTGGTTSMSASYGGDSHHHGVAPVAGGGLVTVPSATGVTTSLKRLYTQPPRRAITVPCRLDNTTLKRCTAVLRDAKGRLLGRASREMSVGESWTQLKVKLNARGRNLVLGSFRGISVRLTLTATQQFGAPTLTATASTKIRPTVALVRQQGRGQFIGDSSWATSSARAWAKRTVPTLKGARRVVCNGYTAGTANNAFARRLSIARAREMCYLLKVHGLKAPVQLKARGNTRPVGSNRTERGRVLNRRVELSVYR